MAVYLSKMAATMFGTKVHQTSSQLKSDPNVIEKMKVLKVFIIDYHP